MVVFINGNEEIAYIKARFNYNYNVEDIIELYYRKIDVNPAQPNPEVYFDEISRELNINKDIVKNVFDIQLEFLRTKGISLI